MNLFINRRDGKILEILMFSNAILITTLRSDTIYLDEIKTSGTIKAQKELKEYIALKKKLIAKNKEWFFNKKYPTKLAKKALRVAEKKVLKKLRNVLSTYEKVRIRKGLDNAIVELDYVPLYLLQILKDEYNELSILNNYNLAKQLNEHKLNSTKDMDFGSDSVKLFLNSLKKLVYDIMED